MPRQVKYFRLPVFFSFVRCGEKVNVEEVQETIEELDEEIEETGEFSEEETVSSKVSGQIKEIYMEEEKNVSDIMLEKGSFRDEEGNEVEGEVESVQGRICIQYFIMKGLYNIRKL